MIAKCYEYGRLLIYSRRHHSHHSLMKVSRDDRGSNIYRSSYSTKSRKGNKEEEWCLLKRLVIAKNSQL